LDSYCDSIISRFDCRATLRWRRRALRAWGAAAAEGRRRRCLEQRAQRHGRWRQRGLAAEVLRRWAEVRHLGMVRVRGEMIGPGTYEHMCYVGKSQSVLVMIDPIVPPRTKHATQLSPSRRRHADVELLDALASLRADNTSLRRQLQAAGVTAGDGGQAVST
jgi:hypothetical protein